MTNTKTTETTKLVTLPVNGAYQPTNEAGQRYGRTGDFVAHEARYIVRSHYGAEHIDFHGQWAERDEAARYARTMSNDAVEVMEVAPYWYVPFFGKVD